MDFSTDLAPLAPPPVQMTRKRKAAMIVQLLLSDGNTLKLADLPEHVQESLAQELGAIRLIDRDTVNAVASEFADILESIGLSAPGGLGAAIEALSPHISPTLARKLRTELDDANGGDPWSRILALDDDLFKTILSSESVEVGAVLLSKLPVTRAAKVLSAVPGEMARRITFAVAKTEEIGPEAVNRIGNGLLTDYAKTKIAAFEEPPVERVGAILNSSPSLTRNDVLEGLDEQDAEFSASVRKKIFTFVNIPERLRPIDIPTVLRAVEPDDLNRALAAAMEAGGPINMAAEYVLSNISQRMSKQIREETGGVGSMKESVAEEAMNVFTGAIRELADAGTITLIEPEEDEDDD